MSLANITGKKIITSLLGHFLSEFKWYRKWIGGTWYKVHDPYTGTGWGGFTEWTQTIPTSDTAEIQLTESWTN
jgi:hypothetical protein